MWPTTHFLSHLAPLALPGAILASPLYSVLLPVTLGGLTGYAVNTRSDTKATYAHLRQPPGRPPAWLFGPVWTVLYAGMGYAAHRAHVRGAGAGVAGLYSLQLALNFAWMPLFFGARRAAAGMVEIVALDAAVLALAATLRGIDGVAAALLAPYLVWLGYASYLTAGIGYLNGWDIEGAVRRGEERERKA